MEKNTKIIIGVVVVIILLFLFFNKRKQIVDKDKLTSTDYREDTFHVHSLYEDGSSVWIYGFGSAHSTSFFTDILYPSYKISFPDLFEEERFFTAEVVDSLFNQNNNRKAVKFTDVESGEELDYGLFQPETEYKYWLYEL